MPVPPPARPVPFPLAEAVRRTLRNAVWIAALAGAPLAAQDTAPTDPPPNATAPAEDAAPLTAPEREARRDADQCAIARVVDPRIADLLLADPDDPSIDITSDTGEMSRAGDASLRGNVTIRTGQRLLRADEAEVSSTERSVKLRGNMEYLDPTLRVSGNAGSFVEGGGGAFEGAQFELFEQSVRGSAAGATVTDGGRNIALEGVRYTACPPGQTDWELSAGKIAIDQQTQIGTGRDVRLDFLGVPILYTPWITFPVGEQRKSGFLFPTVGSGSRTGGFVAVPYYWNLAPHYDATLVSRWYSSRGFRFDPEFRYLTENSRSQFNAEYVVHDEDRGESRSFLDLRNATRLAPRTRARVDASYVSDTDYFEDFGVGFEGTSVTFLDRYADLRHEWGAWLFDARVQDFQVIDRGLPDEDEPYQILPQLNAVGRWPALGRGFSASLAAEAVNFRRDVGVQGARLDAEPAVAWRRDRGGGFVEAGASWRYTQYLLDDVAPGADDAPDREVPTASLDLGLVMERTAGSRGNRVQTLEPRLLYLYVPYRDQDDLPVFDSGEPDLNLVQLFRKNRYVGPDRIGDANQVAVGVTTRLLDASQGRQFLSATLGQAFYIEDPEVRLPDEPVRDRSSSDVIAELDLAAFKNWNARFAYQWNPDESQGERTETFVQYRPASNKVVNFGYRFRRDSLEQVDVSGAWPITHEWRGFARWVYSLREEQTLDQFVGFEYGSCCWAVRLITRRFISSRSGDAETSFGIELELKGLSSVGVDNEAFLRDAIQGYSALPPAPRS
jgi:LPS-assembly protein